MTKLLIAFDDSPSARTAVERAGALLPGAEATVVAVAEGLGALADSASLGTAAVPADVARTAVGRLREAAVAEARELAARGAELARAAGLRATALAPEAPRSVREALLDAARDAGADAVVCGTRGHGRAARAILGSVSSGLVHHGDVPVLVVPADAAAGSGPLAIGFDGSEQALRATAVAGALMPGRSALVVFAWRSRLRHTITGEALRYAPIEEVRETARDLDSLLADMAGETAERGVAAAREAGLDATAALLETGGAASEALLEAAAEHDALALVVGRSGRGAMASAVLGSVASSLLHAADRPVLLA